MEKLLSDSIENGLVMDAVIAQDISQIKVFHI
jgi:hypothetical protein